MSRKYRTTARLRRQQRGVGMIEVLVAVLILAIGLLGLVGLQVRSLQNNRSASERAIAVIETHSIADAMRADRSNALAGAFNINFADATPSGSTFHETAIALWRTNLLNMLGTGATGQISCPTNTGLCDISIRWDDSRGTASSTTFSIVTKVQL